MADISIANLPAFLGSQILPTDLAVLVDVTDTSESTLGTTKRFTFQQLMGSYGGMITGSPNVIAAAPAATSARFILNVNGKTRWYFGTDGVAETGGNTGTALLLVAEADDGSVENPHMQFSRVLTDPIYVNRDVQFLNTAGPRIIIVDGAAGSAAYVQFNDAAVSKWRMGRGVVDNSDDFQIVDGGTTAVFAISRATHLVTIPQLAVTTTFTAPSVDMSAVTGVANVLAGAGGFAIRNAANNTNLLNITVPDNTVHILGPLVLSSTLTLSGALTAPGFIAPNPTVMPSLQVTTVLSIPGLGGEAQLLGSTINGLLYITQTSGSQPGFACLAAYFAVNGVLTFVIIWQSTAGAFSTVPGTPNSVNLINDGVPSIQNTWPFTVTVHVVNISI